MFDADAMMKAVEPPTIKIKGRVYRGRILSLPEWMTFEPEMKRLREASTRLQEGVGSGETMAATVKDLRGVLRAFLDVIFPRPWWCFWRPRVSTLVLEMPVRFQIRALRDFLALQKEANEAEEDAPEELRPSGT